MAQSKEFSDFHLGSSPLAMSSLILATSLRWAHTKISFGSAGTFRLFAASFPSRAAISLSSKECSRDHSDSEFQNKTKNQSFLSTNALQ
jgi:hypothetical protein